MQQNKVEGQTSIDEIIRRNREQLKTIRWLKQQPEEAEDGVVTEIKEIPASSGKYATLLAQSTSTFGNLSGISISQQQRNSNPQTQTVTQMQQTGTPVTARQTGMIQNEAVRTVDKHTADTIDRIAKRIGFSVEFVQGVQEAGSYQDGKIRINTESGDPVRQIFVHELTHHLEQSGEYGALSQAINPYRN